MKKKYRSKALGAVHETITGLYRLGLVNAQTMREFDTKCLLPVKITNLISRVDVPTRCR